MIVHSWDTGIKAGTGHDASACAIFRQYCREPMDEAESGRMLHRLIQIWVGRLEYPALRRQVEQLAERDSPAAILIEDKASGQSLIQDLKRHSSLPVIAIMPKGDKVTRFARVSPMIEAGLVELPHYAGWLAAFEQELLAFPNGAHDDQVDALSQYLNWVRDGRGDQLRVRRV